MAELATSERRNAPLFVSVVHKIVPKILSEYIRVIDFELIWVIFTFAGIIVVFLLIERRNAVLQQLV